MSRPVDEPVIYSERYARDTVMARNARMCEIQIEGVCRGMAETYQHRKRRGHCSPAERWAPSNGLAICGSGTTGCHGWIHRNPEAARERGWEVSAWGDPARESVWLRNPSLLGMELYLLRDDGGLEIAPDDDPKRQNPRGRAV